MTRFRRGAVVAAVLVFAGTVWSEDRQVEPRTPLQKTPTARLQIPVHATGRLIVKFLDEYRARCTDDGVVVSATNLAMHDVQAVVDDLGLVVQPTFRHPPELLEALETRAREYSGIAQPDLGGIHYVTAPAVDLLSAARALNELDTVEWVVVEDDPRPAIAAKHPEPPQAFAGALGPAPGALGGGRSVAAPGTIASPVSTPTPADVELTDGDGPANPEGPQACCLPPESGSVCTTLSAFDCAVIGGTPWSGACDASGFCGACCLPEGCSDSWIESRCVAVMGASYAGDRLQCSDLGACPPGACCLPNEECVQDFTEGQCLLQGGQWLPNALCDDVDCESDCGQVPGSCFRQDGNIAPFCSNEDCCNQICDLDDYCCDEEDGAWDSLCSALGNLYCEPPQRNWNSGTEMPANSGDDIMFADRCASPLNGDCFFPHNTAGCRNQLCCNRVCDFSGFCCSENGQWDGFCAEIAFFLCVEEDSPGRTEDYSELQGYLTPFGYFPVPPELGLPNFTGWSGEGYNLFATHLLGEELLDLGIDGTGDGNLTWGRNAKVAVIGFAYLEDHEDLNVRLERGQTMIPIAENSPSLYTAMLSIIGARDNDRGVVGIVPEAKTYFYPLTSVEEGPRQEAAWISAVAELKPGDVIAAGYWYLDDNLNTNLFNWTLNSLATSSGITVCVPAGDDCDDLDDFDDNGDSGAIVIGACSPGTPWYRLGTSNYCTNPITTRGNIAHIRSWGTAVVAAGYGDLFLPDGDFDRSYTRSFGGTVAATSIVAGLSAMMQGINRQFYGIAGTPAQIRDAMLERSFTIPVARENLNGNNADQLCAVDFDEDGEVNTAGQYFEVRSASADLISDTDISGFSDAPLVDDVVILRGTAVTGNRYSVKGLDGITLGLNSLQTDRNDGPQSVVGLGGGSQEGLFVPEVQSITYLASGQITDVVAVAHADFFDVNFISVQVVPSWSPTFDILFAELYDWRRQRWESIGLIIDGPPDEGVGVAFAGLAPQRFVRDGDNRILARLWTLGFTSVNIGGETGSRDYRWEYDLIDIRAGEEIGEEIP